jgi:hypothetical protein
MAWTMLDTVVNALSAMQGASHLHQASIRWASMLQLGGYMVLLKQAVVSVILLVLLNVFLALNVLFTIACPSCSCLAFDLNVAFFLFTLGHSEQP